MQLLWVFPEVLFDDPDRLSYSDAVFRKTDSAGRPGPLLIKCRGSRKSVDLAHAASRLTEIDAVGVGKSLHDFYRLGTLAQQCVTVAGSGGCRVSGEATTAQKK